MSWLGLVRSLVSLALVLAQHMRTRQLIEAGAAGEIADQLRFTHDRIAEAMAARRAARERDGSAAGLRGDDGYRRED